MLRSFHRFSRDLLLVNNLIKLNIIANLHKESREIKLRKYSSSATKNPEPDNSEYFSKFILSFGANDIINEKLKEMIKMKAQEADSKKKFMNRSEAEILTNNMASKNKVLRKTKNKPLNTKSISSNKLCDDFFLYLSSKGKSNYFLRNANASTNTKFLHDVSKFTNSQVRFDNHLSLLNRTFVNTRTTNIKNNDFKLQLVNTPTGFQEPSNFNGNNTQRTSELNLAGTIEKFSLKKLANKLNKYDCNNTVYDSLMKDLERNVSLSRIMGIKMDRKKREIEYDEKIRTMIRQAKSCLRKDSSNKRRNSVFNDTLAKFIQPKEISDKDQLVSEIKDKKENKPIKILDNDDSFIQAHAQDVSAVISDLEGENVYNRLNKNLKNNNEFFKRSMRLNQLEIKYSKMVRQRKTINFSDFKIKFNSTKREL